MHPFRIIGRTNGELAHSLTAVLFRLIFCGLTPKRLIREETRLVYRHRSEIITFHLFNSSTVCPCFSGHLEVAGLLQASKKPISLKFNLPNCPQHAGKRFPGTVTVHYGLRGGLAISRCTIV